MRKGAVLRAGFAAALALAGALSLALPWTLIGYAPPLSADPAANIWLIRGFAVALLGLGAAVFAEPLDGTAPPRWPVWLVLVPALYFLVLTPHLADWWIDDAGITFAYARSLAEGYGLVAQPGLAPEEGYSSTVWMLTLALASRLGADIPAAAKTLGIACSAAAIVITGLILWRETRSALAVMLAGVAVATAPTVVWAASGQEHAAQALILLLAVWCAWAFEAWRLPVAAVLALFVLTRPEAPLIVIGVFLAGLWLTWREGRWLSWGDVALAAVPFIAFVGLMAFRIAYFGDPLPNPFYAKTASSSFTGLLNPMGGGWGYVVAGIRDTGLILLLPLVFLARRRRFSAFVVVALAIVLAQAVFVVWAKGDWMGQYRFLMPVLPVAVLLAGLGLPGAGPFRTRAVLSVAAVLFLLRVTAVELAAFKETPTTPMAVVTEIGEGFADLGRRLGIADPVLAHHDAGGITYHRPVRLIDLGGLVDREIARHMNDRAFLTRYLVDELRPDFVFGARNFAAASGFAETEAFTNAYVPVEFVGQPLMKSYLTHIRRDRVHAAPGIDPVRDGTGQVTGLRVLPAE